MSKADEAFTILKRRIITGVYPAMSDLDEERLCAEFRVSRTPLREAILRLKNMGYVTVIPNKGTLIRPVSHRLIDEIYTMRLLNEPYICKAAAHLMPAQLLRELRAQLSGGDRFFSGRTETEGLSSADGTTALNSGESFQAVPPAHGGSAESTRSRTYYIELDSRLHTVLLQYCGNSFLIAAMQNVYDHNERIRHFASDPQHDHSIEEHLAILEAMLAGDAERIERSVLAHVRASREITERCYREQPFYDL